MRGDVAIDLPQGQRVTLRELPVGAAAVYVPGGRAPYPSTAVMGVVAARAAGVLDVAVCSPPGRDGEIDAAVLGTCRLLGVERVYRMGGAQAVAALAYGTQTVRAVDVIVGPGNLYVQEAKRQLCDRVGIDGFAGPSDLLVLFGEDADPRLVALDLAAQAEHGAGSLVAAISPSEGALDLLADELERLAAEHPELRPAACVLVQSADAREALEIASAFAPEHLQLIGAEPEALAGRARAAGCVFVGAAAATAFGDYVAGSNHILPTSGAARFASGLAPRHFRRRMAEVRVGEVGGETVAQAGGGRCRRSRGRRASSCTRARWRRAWGRIHRDEPHGEDRAQDGRDHVELALALDGGGAGGARDGGGLLRPHARPAGASRAPRPGGPGQRRPGDGRAPHGGGHRDRAGPGARPGAGRARGDRALRLGDWCRWTRRARAARSTSRVVRTRCSRRSCRRARRAASSTSWPRSSSARWRTRRS